MLVSPFSPTSRLQRGQECFEKTRILGDRWLETLTAGGMSLTHAALGGRVRSCRLAGPSGDCGSVRAKHGYGASTGDVAWRLFGGAG